MSTPFWSRIRRSFSLKLRAMMVLVLLVGGGFGWVAHKARVQRDAVAEIRRAGGSVTYFWHFGLSEKARHAQDPPWPKRMVELLGVDLLGVVESVFFDALVQSELGEGSIAALSRLDRLKRLTLHGLRVTDEQVSALSRLKSLEVSEIGGDQAKVAGLPHLGRFSNLRALSLPTRTPVTDAELEFLEGLRSLEQLSFNVSEVTDQGLIHLAGLSRLKQLNLAESQITDQGLERPRGLTSLRSLLPSKCKVSNLQPLQGLNQLRILDPRNTEVDDIGLEPIRDLNNLDWLWLDHTEVGDGGLASISGLSRLRELSLSYTTVTSAGIRNLRRLSNLESLDLGGLPIIDDSPSELGSLTQRTSLDLSRTQISDKSLPWINGRLGLETLDLGNTKVGDVGIASLSGHPRLTRIDLRLTQVTGWLESHASGQEVILDPTPGCSMRLIADDETIIKRVFKFSVPNRSYGENESKSDIPGGVVSVGGA